MMTRMQELTSLRWSVICVAMFAGASSLGRSVSAQPFRMTVQSPRFAGGVEVTLVVPDTRSEEKLSDVLGPVDIHNTSMIKAASQMNPAKFFTVLS
jgi:hypothetical protein